MSWSSIRRNNLSDDTPKSCTQYHNPQSITLSRITRPAGESRRPRPTRINLKVPSNRGELAKMQKFLPDFLILISPSFLLLPCSCHNNPPTKYPRVIYIPNMSHSKSDLGPHSPMAASIQLGGTPRKPSDLETASLKVGEKGVEVTEKSSMEKRDDSVDGGSIGPTYDHTHRKLKPRHVQLIGIGGTIGTALYVQIGSGLRTSGPGSLFLGFSIWYVYTPTCLSFSSLVCSFGETSGVSTKSCWVDILDKVSIYKSRLHISKAKQSKKNTSKHQNKKKEKRKKRSSVLQQISRT